MSFECPSIVHLLIDSGADVDDSVGKLGTVLQVASLLGIEDVARLLVEKGANVHSQGGIYDSALAAAAVGSHVSTMRLLLKHGAVASSTVEAVMGMTATSTEVDIDKGVEILPEWDARVRPVAAQQQLTEDIFWRGGTAARWVSGNSKPSTKVRWLRRKSALLKGTRWQVR